VVDVRASQGGAESPMPLSFAVAFSALLFFSPGAMTFTATAAVATAAVIWPAQTGLYGRALVDCAVTIVATQAAGLAYTVLGGAVGGALVLPADGVPIAAAVLAFSLVRTVSSELLASVSGRPRGFHFWRRALRDCPTYVISAGAAIGLVELIAHRAWE